MSINVTFYPGQSTDDGYETGETPHVMDVTDYAVATGINNWFWAGARFPNINIPKGATILSAHLRITNSGYAEGATALKIYGEAIDNAPTLDVNDPTNITDRTPTTNYGTVSLSAGVGWGDVENCINLAATIQEIVNRNNWSSGNALMLLMYPNGTNEWDFISYDGEGSNYHLKLDITYIVPKGRSQGHIF